MNPNNSSSYVFTVEARQLNDALVKRGLVTSTEHWDGHKHIDIAIPNAHIFIEVDGLHHFTDPMQIERDFKRDHFSDGDDYDTIHVPNTIVQHHCDEVADAIQKVVAGRQGS